LAPCWHGPGIKAVFRFSRLQLCSTGGFFILVGWSEFYSRPGRFSVDGSGVTSLLCNLVPEYRIKSQDKNYGLFHKVSEPAITGSLNPSFVKALIAFPDTEKITQQLRTD
jgi:hypothetical protein